MYNSVGSVSSEYTEWVPIDLLKPESFEQMKARQINETLIRLTFKKPKTHSQFVSYKIYRDSMLIFTMHDQSSDLLNYDDIFVFAPNQYYKYNVFACNQIGCSSDENFSVFIKTCDLPPVLVYKPILLDLGPDYIKIDASLSVILRLNQKIIEYRYFLNNKMALSTPEPVVLIKNLQPNTKYLINLEVCTFLDLGCLKSNDYLEVKTYQVLPVIDFETICSSGMRHLTLEWPSTQQEIDNYVVRYKLEKKDFSNLVVKDKNSVTIEQLRPFSQYEIVFGGCNKVGCSYSKSFECNTTGRLPNVSIEAVITTQGFLIQWNIDDNFKDQDLQFKLFRSVLKHPILFDQNFKSIRLQDNVVYVGTRYRYEDSNVYFDTEYSYYVEMKTMFGSVKSDDLNLRTKVAAPQLLVQIGSIRHVTNDSVSLMLRPPLRINGRLENVSVQIKTGRIEMTQYLSHGNLSGEKLLEFLDKVILENLLPDSNYELKTNFCNQLFCLLSLQTIKFKTLPNERIEFFDALWRVDKIVVFKWTFRKVTSRYIK